MANISGQISTAAGGVGSLFDQYQMMLNQGVFNPNAPSQTFDAYGDPQYNLGDLTQQTLIKPRGAQGGEILSASGTGATTGAAIGSIIPGLGTIAGGVIGGLIGGVGSILTGSARKKEMQRRQRLAMANLMQAQKQYGINKGQYFNTQLGNGLYNQTNYDKLNNLYMSQSGQTEL